MTTIGSLNSFGSGLDVEAIVKALVDADVAPKTNHLNRREAELTAELSAVGSLKSKLSDLNTAIEDLADGTAFDLLKIDSPDAVSIVQTGSPAIGRYGVNISQLADSQVLASSGFTSASTVVGTGTLTFKLGQPSYVSGTSGAYSGFTAVDSKTVSVTIDSSNNTLSGIRDAVNASSVGITASLVVDGSETRLLFTADDSGANTAISISADDADDNDGDTSGLSQLAYNVDSGSFVGNSTGAMSEVRSSKDAVFSLNGLSLTNSSNTIVGLVDGLDFTLNSVTSSEAAVVITKDTAAIEAKVKSFVDAYNDYKKTFDSLTDYELDTGVLSGDSTARRLQSVIRSSITDVIDNSNTSITALSELGVEADRYGDLSLDSAKFQSKLSSTPEDMKLFFSGNVVTSGLSDNTDSAGMADRLKSSIDDYITVSTGMLSTKETRIDSALEDITDDRLDVLARMTSLEERYTKQFTAMDTLVSQLRSTSDFLTNQMDALKAAANR